MQHTTQFAGSTAGLSKAPVRVCVTHRGSLQVRNAVKEVFMPALSSTMTQGKIVSWLKSPGDKVKKGESIVVVESDKADMDVECFNDGYLGAIVIPEGGSADVGAAIAFIAETEAELDAAKAKASGAAPAAAAAAPPPPPPAPAAAAPAPAPAAAPAPAPAAVAPPPPPAAPVVVAQPRADGRVVASPYAKKLAKELGVDLASVVGTGPAGRITAGDVEAAKAGNGAVAVAAPPAPAATTTTTTVVTTPPPAAPAAAPAPAPVPAAAPAAAGAPTGTVPFTGMQMAVSKNMLESLKVPEFRVSMTIRTDELDALYKKLKPKGVTMTCLLGKACGAALAKHPIINAATTADGTGVKYNDNVNVAMAVAMDGGLITPVLKNADVTDIYTMSRQWADLVKRARSKQLAPDEYNSGTFAVSNLGMFGVDSFDAILPPGMGAIIAIGGSKNVVSVDAASGRFGVEKHMTVNLTADHRHIYGADAAEFLLTLKSIIEDPEQLLFL